MKKEKKIKKFIKKIIQDIFLEGKLNEKKAENYIKILSKLPNHEAISYLKQLQKQIKVKLAESTLIVESAVKLSKNEAKKIEYVMKNNHKVNASRFIVNPSLIGGLKIKIGDSVYDDSINLKIREVRQAIYG